MRKQVLDTSVLIRHWRRCRGPTLAGKTDKDAVGWARALIAFHQTEAIVTPVLVEFLGGVASGQELRLARAFLGEFRCIDRGNIPAGDWEEATRLAQRTGKDRRPRHLGDCLIRAIANRLKHGVWTYDEGFPP
jgi:predicted nucleic acid-binding protein